MRVRLVYTLSFWLLAAVGVSVLAMGAVTAWHLRQGFGAYLQARDVERLNSFVQVVEDRLTQAGSADDLVEGRLDMRSLLDELSQREGVAGASEWPDAPPPRRGDPPAPRRPGPGLAGERWPPPQDRRFNPPQGPPQDRPQDPPWPPPRGEHPDPVQHPPPPPGDRFGNRVALFASDGSLLRGRPLPPSKLPWIELPLRFEGRVVALVRLRPVDRVPDGNELHFLRKQYLGIAGVAAALMLLALAAAWWLARQWARPLAAVQDATARIARGDLSVRLPPGRSDEIGDVVRNVNLMAESLQRMEGARRRWIADMSHELRTPLTGLRGEIEALVDGVRPLTPAAMLSLREDVLRLGALIDDLHLLAMADLHSLPCRFADADAAGSVQTAMQRFEARAAAAGLSLAWAGSPPAALPVCWDSARIGQLLANLLENSLRYTDAPGRIELGLQRIGDTLRLSIDDSAPGVAASDLPRLFEPLYRADAARSRHSGGSGLGLAICVAIAEAHGGRLQALASRLGGLQVRLDLPLNARRPAA